MENKLKLVRGERFIFTTRVLTDESNQAQLLEIIPVQGDPPIDFKRFILEVTVKVAKQRHPQTGEEMVQTAARKVPVDAETIIEAFEALPDLAAETAKSIREEYRRKLLTARGPIPVINQNMLRGKGP